MSKATLHSEKKKELIPQLRFPGFEGEWEYKKLKDITTYVDYRGRAPIKTEDGYFLVTAKNIKKGFIDYECSKEYVAENNYSNVMSKGTPKIGDVLFTTEAPMGNVALVDNADIALAQRVIKFRSKEMLSNSYLLYYMLSDSFQKNISKKAIGTTVQGISGKELHQIKISITTLPEQQKIASFLSVIDEKIQQLCRKAALLKQYKKGVMQQLFSCKLRFKDENGKDYPDWEEKKLGEVCKLNPKNSLLPSSFVYIDLESVVDGQLLKETRINLSEAPSRAQRLLSCEDILFQMVRPYQKNNLFFNKNGEYVASTGYAQLRAKESSMFLYQLIHTADFVNKVIDRCTGTSYPAINSTDLSNIEISFPSLPEQQKIAYFLSGIDGKIEQVNGELVKTQLFKKGLLQQMFV